MAQANSRRAGRLSRRAARLACNIRGVSKEYLEFSGYDPELGRAAEPLRSRARAGPSPISAGARPIACSRARRRSTSCIKINGVHFRVVGVNEEKGSLFGNSQDEFIVDPARALPEAVRLAPQPRAHGEAARSAPDRADDGRGARGAADAAQLKPKEDDNFGMYTSDTLMNLFRVFTAGIVRGAHRRRRRCRSSSAASSS